MSCITEGHYGAIYSFLDKFAKKQLKTISLGL